MPVPLLLAPGARASRWAATVAVVLLAGCTSTEPFWNKDGPPSPGVPCQIATTWQNSVLFAPDPTKNGNPNPGLAGRLYLFGPEVGYPMTGKGSLVVDLYDETKGPPVMKEQFRIDAETLARLVKQDMIGWGYTVFLPMAKYTPEMTKIRLKVCYQSPKTAPLFTESAVTLASGNGVVNVTSSSRPLEKK